MSVPCAISSNAGLALGSLFRLVAISGHENWLLVSKLDVTLADLLDLPAELSAKARAMPSFSERLLRFIRREEAMNEQHQQRYSAKTLAVVQREGPLEEAEDQGNGSCRRDADA